MGRGPGAPSPRAWPAGQGSRRPLPKCMVHRSFVFQEVEEAKTPGGAEVEGTLSLALSW